VPDNQDETGEDAGPMVRAEHEAAEIVARARRQAEAIVAEARGSASAPVPNALAALGSNADEIIGQVRKLITKQRQLQAEREELLAEIDTLKSERDELVQRLTDAVERMEELAKVADMAQMRQPMQAPAPMPVRTSPPPPPQPAPSNMPPADDTSLAARLRQAETAEAAKATEAEDTSLAARLRQAEAAEVEYDDAVQSGSPDVADPGMMLVGNDGRSFYDRHSAKLPRLEGDGGRSVLSAIGGMRPEPDPKGRKGRKRSKK
jgi:DNA repair exonuclease SbcCD ATPase subunit